LRQCAVVDIACERVHCRFRARLRVKCEYRARARSPTNIRRAIQRAAYVDQTGLRFSPIAESVREGVANSFPEFTGDRYLSGRKARKRCKDSEKKPAKPIPTEVLKLRNCAINRLSLKQCAPYSKKISEHRSRASRQEQLWNIDNSSLVGSCMARLTLRCGGQHRQFESGRLSKHDELRF